MREGTGPRRQSGRVILIDPDDRVLLLHLVDPMIPADAGCWITPGGGLEPGEQAVDAAVRELAEETGLRVDSKALVGPLWRRHSEFEFMGEPMRSTETFFAYRLQALAGLTTDGFNELEKQAIDDVRWWSGPELKATEQQIYPQELALRLTEALAAVSGRNPRVPREPLLIN